MQLQLSAVLMQQVDAKAQLSAVLTQQVDAKAQLSALVQQVATKEFPFSAAPTYAVRNLLTSRGIHERDNLPLPLIDHLKPAASPTPFSWPPNIEETAASPALLELLERWVKSDSMPALEHAFMDVQDLAGVSPLVIFEPGVGNFKGASDMVILRQYAAASSVLSPLSNCAVAVDWKTPTALKRGVKQQAALQVLALSEFNGGEAPPVFFTDLKTHFLCYIMRGGFLCCFRGADGTNNLSLAEGVGLIRFFLLQDMECIGSRLEAAVVPTSLGGSGLTGAAVQGIEAPTAPERLAMSCGGGGGSGGCVRSSEDYGALECTENYDPSQGAGDCSVVEAQALHIAEFQSAALALTHQLTAHGGINRQVFFQQGELPGE